MAAAVAVVAAAAVVAAVAAVGGDKWSGGCYSRSKSTWGDGLL